jgi:hypothetical protein
VNRLVPASIAFLGAALIVIAALVPEYRAGGVGITPLDPERMDQIAILVGVLVQAGLLLMPAALLALGQARSAAGGILVGAGVLGLTIRLVRIAQLGQTPDFDPAIGSWIDLLADGAALIAGVLALTASEDEDEDEEWEDEAPIEADLPPPPGENEDAGPGAP